jgi:hypothetical protein
VRSLIVCSGRGLGAQQQIVFVDSEAAGTLLGPETTPGPPVVGVVLSPRLVVGCGV